MFRGLVRSVMGGDDDGDSDGDTSHKRARPDDVDDVDELAQPPPPRQRPVAEPRPVPVARSPAASLTVLLQHPKNALVRIPGGWRGVPVITYAGKRCSGLLRHASAVFYPDYDYRRARHVDTAVDGGEYTIPLPVDGARRGGHGHVVGAARGTAVDEDIRLWVNSPEKFYARPSHPPMCVDVIDAFDSWEWKCIVSQFPIVADNLHIGTRIDIIAVDSAGDSLALELKTGYETNLHNYVGHMRGPLADLVDSPMNQHYLQVGLEVLFARYRYGFEFRRAYVIQAIQTRGVIPHKLPAWFWDRAPQIWEYFCAHAMRRLTSLHST